MQWKNISLVGNTISGNAVISAIPDTTGVEVGMFVGGTGVQVGSKVLAFDGVSVTLDKIATSTGAGNTFEFYFEIIFDYPPEEKKPEKYDAKDNTSISISGVRQVSNNYIEVTRNLKFRFVSDTIIALYVNFFVTHGSFGSAFRYFDDKTSGSYTQYELSTINYIPEKDTGRTTTDFPVVMRRVI